MGPLFYFPTTIMILEGSEKNLNLVGKFAKTDFKLWQTWEFGAANVEYIRFRFAADHFRLAAGDDVWEEGEEIRMLPVGFQLHHGTRAACGN